MNIIRCRLLQNAVTFFSNNCYDCHFITSNTLIFINLVFIRTFFKLDVTVNGMLNNVIIITL